MYKILKTFLLGALVSVFYACSYNTEELPAPEDVVVDPNAPSITYTSHAKVILDAQCVGCHSSGGTGQLPFLDTYSSAQTQSGRIEARGINESPSVMPPAGSMSQAMKDTLQLWINQGALQ